jgi:tetratricopeptide (TPR) repeat protein
MRRIRMLLLATIGLSLLFCHSGTVMAAARNEDPAIFQESYDQEAIGRMDEALAALDRLSEGKRGGYLALLRRAWLLYKLGRHAQSSEVYEQASALDPKAIEARLGVLLPLMAEQRWPQAEQVARQILKVDGGNYLATLRLAFVQYNQKRYGESRTLYKKLAEAYPSDVEVRTGLAWALLKLGKSSHAAAIFREVLECAPKNALAQQGLAAASK